MDPKARTAPPENIVDQCCAGSVGPTEDLLSHDMGIGASFRGLRALDAFFFTHMRLTAAWDSSSSGTCRRIT